MATVHHPNLDEKIVELTSAIPTGELLAAPEVSNVLVAWDPPTEGFATSTSVEVSWTTTVRLFPQQAEGVINGSV